MVQQRMMNRLGTVSAILLGAVLVFAPVALATETKSVARAIPDDVSVFVRGKANPEREFLNQHMEEVWTAFQDSGIIETVMDIFSTRVPSSEQEEIKAILGQVERFSEMVDWMSLIDSDFVFSMRMQFPTPEYIIATRPKKDKYDEAFNGLKHILTEIQKFESERFVLESASRDGVEMMALSFGTEVPVELCIAGTDGAIFFTTSSEDVRRCIDLYNGKGGSALVDHAWFKEGMKELPAFEDSQTFFNVDSFLNGYVGMLQQVLHSESDDKKKAILDVVKAGIDQFRVVKYIAAVETTEGNRVIGETFTRYAEHADSLPLAKAFAGQDTFTDFHKMVPRDATSFSLSGGVNLHALYKMCTGFVEEKIPEGKGMLQQWAAMQEQWGLNVEQDILSWISGETIAFSLPGSGGGGMMGGGMGDSITMIKVNDVEKGQAMINHGLQHASKALQQFGQSLIIRPAKDAGDGFQSIMFPMFPIMQPVIGFEGDYLVIATSGKVLETLRKVQAGEAPSILENEKFRALGINPDGPVHSISYTDQSATYEGMAQAMAMVPMFAGMALQGNDEQTKMARDLVNVLPLLAPVIEKFNFHLATSAYTTSSGSGSYTRTVNSYRKDDEGGDDKDI